MYYNKLNMLKEKKVNILIYLSVVYFLFMAPFFIYAQIPGIGDLISFKVYPENPKANQIVNVEIESFSVDLDRAEQISWTVNGELVARKAGIKQIQFETGELGSRSVVAVTIYGTEIGTISESITIAPTEVDLLWQAETYTPPFYKGKALPASSADITILAIPYFITTNGVKLDSDDLIFTWEKDGKVLGNYSGRGRDNIKIKGAKIYSGTRIKVEVSSVGNSLSGKKSVIIPSFFPRIVFYKNDPILGIRYEKAVWDTAELFDEEVTITAHPYFFSSKNRTNSDFEYKWKVNGSSVDGSPDDESSLVLRQVGDGEGTASVSLSIQNLDKILQSAGESFSLLFGRNSNTPFNF